MEDNQLELKKKIRKVMEWDQKKKLQDKERVDKQEKEYRERVEKMKEFKHEKHIEKIQELNKYRNKKKEASKRMHEKLKKREEDIEIQRQENRERAEKAKETYQINMMEQVGYIVNIRDGEERNFYKILKRSMKEFRSSVNLNKK